MKYGLIEGSYPYLIRVGPWLAVFVFEPPASSRPSIAAMKRVDIAAWRSGQASAAYTEFWSIPEQIE
jgi:hypothetical protein